MSLSKVVLIIVGIALVVMGVLALIPTITMGAEPMWHSYVKIAVGLIAVIIPFTDK